MPLTVLIALWAFMRANPGADFDAFVAAYSRAVKLAWPHDENKEGHHDH